jgi:cation diffusion facilitator family transporter
MKNENQLLKLSALGGLFFTSLGIGWGLVIDSEMIRFDGIYSLISLLLSMMAIYICSFIAKKDKINFPFGKEMLSPIVIIIKSIVLIIMCSISLLNSLKTMVSGGNSIDTSFAIAYTIVSIIGCSVTYLYMKRAGKKLSSDILRAESSQWLMDTLISVGAFIGFIMIIIIDNTRLSYLSRYVDSLMVMISSIIFLRVPLATFIKAFKELILVKANDEINDCINKVVRNIENEYKFEESITRVSKTGNSLRIEIDFIFNKNSNMKELKEMDVVRERINDLIQHIKYDKWLNVSFTGNKKWIV